MTVPIPDDGKFFSPSTGQVLIHAANTAAPATEAGFFDLATLYTSGWRSFGHRSIDGSWSLDSEGGDSIVKATYESPAGVRVTQVAGKEFIDITAAEWSDDNLARYEGALESGVTPGLFNGATPTNALISYWLDASNESEAWACFTPNVSWGKNGALVPPDPTSEEGFYIPLRATLLSATALGGKTKRWVKKVASS